MTPHDSVVGDIIVQAADLQRRVAELGAEVTRDYRGKDLLLVGVLKGAVFFLSDLMRHIEVPCEVDFMAVASYGSSTDSPGGGGVFEGLDAPIGGKDVPVGGGILDLRLTPSYLLRTFKTPEPKTAQV